jgi:hypothetical protein
VLIVRGTVARGVPADGERYAQRQNAATTKHR